MGYLQQLRALIDSDPANTGKTDEGVEAWVNEVVPYDKDVAWTDLVVWASAYDVVNTLEVAKSAGQPADRKLAAGALLLLNTGNKLTSSRSDVRAMVATLGGVFGETELNALSALMVGTRPRRNTLRAPHVGEIMKARGL